MRKMVALITALGIMLPAIAQREKDIPDFGSVDKADLLLTECDFDKNAEAMVLFDAAETYLDIYGTRELVRHVRIKILKDKGLKAADIHIPFTSYKNLSSIKGLTAQTYNLDANGNVVVTKVDKKSIFEKSLNKRRSEQVFTFPEVKAGSVIEYKYTHSNALYLNWYFQTDIPVKYGRYRVDFPEELEFVCRPFCVLPVEQKSESKGRRNIKTVFMKNVPALRDEPYITCDEDYLQRVEAMPTAVNPPGAPRVSLLSNWPRIVRSLSEDEDFGLQLKRDIPRTRDLDSMLKLVKSPVDKMNIIHKYVRKNMEWNGYDNIWALEGVRSAWKDKKGTSGEINLILVNLLKDAGIKASPLLISTREHGRINTSNPDASQFDKVLAYVSIFDKHYILDATEKFTPSHLIPYEAMYSEGLAIEKIDTWEWGWKPIWDNYAGFKETVVLMANIDGEGNMKGNANVSSYNYSRVNRMATLKNGQDKLVEKYFTSTNPGFKIDSFKLEHADEDTMPLVQQFQFNHPISASGDYKYFSVNMFTGLEKNPFVADNRFSDVFFGTNQNYQLVANITIPDDYEFEALPKSVRMIMPDTSISITRRLASSSNVLSVRVSLEFKKPFYSPEEYPDFKEFYKQLYALLNEQYAIRKKTKA